MKRIIVLIDGTWNDEGKGADTNIAKLDPQSRNAVRRLILAKSAAETPQICHYHDGVGAEGDFLNRLLGLFVGLGLKKVVQDCYGFLVSNYESGDEIYIFGFSRGAYAARALAGLIGASGIQRKPDPQKFEIAWCHYRLPPAVEHGGSDRSLIGRYVHTLKMETNGVVERIRSLLARFSEDEETVRRLVATDASFDALCNEYCKVIELLDGFETQAKQLRERRAWLEEELLTRIEGYQPQ
jgi:uncharacterized protein (DUF2235 family)